jgi:hypothetical protein
VLTWRVALVATEPGFSEYVVTSVPAQNIYVLAAAELRHCELQLTERLLCISIMALSRENIKVHKIGLVIKLPSSLLASSALNNTLASLDSEYAVKLL